MFQGLSELVSLDLKGNEISVVEDQAWSALPALKHLDISANKLSGLQEGTFTSTFQRTQPTTTRVLYIYGMDTNRPQTEPRITQENISTMC